MRMVNGREFVSRVGLLLALLVLASCALQPSGDATRDIVKSENDYRSYRYLTLPNQLRVLLISDPSSDKAAASLDVNVGSGSDPADYPGLAHFLEHMLFLGTEKYPEAGEYQAFISSHGGSHNAYTSFEHTNYFFDIDPAYLDPTLDRFAQFFIAPLFNTEYVDREKNAVHSEYMAKIKDDSRRSLDVFKAVINPQHPFAKFSVGNLQTLDETGKAVPLQQQLLDFHAQYYSANIMTLVVLGNESLPDLETMVRQKFSAVANAGVVVNPIEEPLFSDDQALPRIVNIRPEKRQRVLSVVFPTADERQFYREKPLNYIGNILGHEGEHSLFSWLKGEGWAEGLSAGPGLSYEGGGTFNIAVQLTPEGEHHTDAIVAAIFQAIERIEVTPEQGWLYREQKALAEQGFRYQEQAAPIHYVMGLSTSLHYYQPEDVLQGPYIMDHFDRNLVQRFLADMVPQNCLITLSTPSVKTDTLSPFYATPYSVQPVDDGVVHGWQSVALNDAIGFPRPNPFIAEDLALKSPSFDEEESALLQADKPALIEEGPGYRLWYKPEQKFAVPKGSILVDFTSPIAAQKKRDKLAANSASMVMLTELVMDALNELSYPASLAGLSYAISPSGQGLSLQISGYNDKQLLLLRDILSTLTDADFSEKRFENIRREQIRQLENTIKEQPYRRAFESLSESIIRLRPDDAALLAAYKAMSLRQVLDFRQRLLEAGDLKMLVHGNYRRQEAITVSDTIRQALLLQAAAGPEVEVTRLQPGEPFAIPFASDYSDAALLLYVQGSDLDLTTRAGLGLASQYLRSDFYTTLRTEKQLGYVVVSGAFPVRDVPGVFFLIQSPVAAVGDLQAEISGYLQTEIAAIGDVTQQQFDRQREALILRLTEEPKSLWEQSRKYWDQIDQHYWNFDLQQRLVKAMRDLSLADWQALVRRELGKPERALWIYAPGKLSGKSAIQGRVVEDVWRWKQSQPSYRFP